MAVTYQERKEQGLCTYPGCPEQAGDTCLCESHRKAARARDAKHYKRARKERLASSTCTRCGARRHKGSAWCLRCLIQLGKHEKPDHNKDRDKPRDRTRLVTEGDGRTRRRYIGQGKRGAQPVSANDAQDLADVLKLIQRAKDGLAFIADQQDLGRQQRKAGEHEALGFAHLAQRLIGDVLRRHRYETPRGEETDS